MNKKIIIFFLSWILFSTVYSWLAIYLQELGYLNFDALYISHQNNLMFNAEVSKIKTLNTKGYPVFFMGDFNSEPNEDRILSLKKIMNDSREVSQEKPFGPSGTFNNFNYNEPIAKLIDYIFVSKENGMKVKKYAVLTDSKNLHYPSDHFPVFAQITLQ